MNAPSGQFDLFDLDPGYRETPRRIAPVRRSRQLPNIAPGTGDDLVQLLEDTGRFKVLRKLAPRPIIDRASSRFPRLAVLVDVETTGLNHSRDEVIEIGAVAFTYDDAGLIGDVVGVFSALRQPSGPIPAEITRLTGITDEMVAGQVVDLAALGHRACFVGPAAVSAVRHIKVDAFIGERTEARIKHAHDYGGFVVEDGAAILVPKDRGSRTPGNVRICACIKLIQIACAVGFVPVGIGKVADAPTLVGQFRLNDRDGNDDLELVPADVQFHSQG